MEAAIAKALQEVFILGVGRSASQIELETLYGYRGSGDWKPLIDLVNQYVGAYAQAHGAAKTVQALAEKGLGLKLDKATAEAIAAHIAATKMSWADVFVWCMSQTDALGKTLDNRAEASMQFLAGLQAANKGSLFVGAAVNNAVKTLIQGIGATQSSLDAGKAGLQALIANLTAVGIKSYVIDGYVKNATVFVDTNSNGQIDAGEFSTTTAADGSYVLPANVAGGKSLRLAARTF